MSRPFNRAQALENDAFIVALIRTGNIRAAAREIGRGPATMHHRRAGHLDFAQRWDAAVVMADALLMTAGGSRLANGSASSGTERRASHRTAGGEPVVVQRRDGKLQLRSAQPGKLTRQCEQAFLAALSATANIRLSAAAAGASVAAFYRRKRRNPGFAREMQLALEMGYERLEIALLESFEVEAHAHDAWRHNDPPPVPPMTVDQALRLLQLHHNTTKLGLPASSMRRRGETADQWSERRAANYIARQASEAERLKIAETNRALSAALDRLPFEPPAPAPAITAAAEAMRAKR